MYYNFTSVSYFLFGCDLFICYDCMLYMNKW